MAKIYTSRGAIIIEDVLPDIISINPGQFDWDVQNGVYTVRDKIQNQSYTLGVYSNIEDQFGSDYLNDGDVINVLNSFVNKSAANQNTSPVLITQMAREVANTTLTSIVNVGDTSINVVSSAGAVVGSYIVIFNKLTNRSYQGKAISVVSNTINLDSPLDGSFDIANSKVFIGETNINVNGSLTPVDYKFRADEADPVNIEVNIARIIVTMQLSTAGNLSLFGNIARLAKGILFKKTGNFPYNIFNVKDNREIKNMGYDLEFISPLGVAPDGLSARITFTLMGTALSVKPGENLILKVQDDLTGLTKFEITCEGYIVQ